MTLFDNCLINKAESQDLNISQLEFSAKEKGLFKEMCFKAENVFLQLFKKKTVIKKTLPKFNLKPYFLNIYASTHNILLSENLAVGELFIGKPPVDERRSNNDFFSPNRTLSARRLIVERKMTPILSKSLESESAACVPPNHGRPWPSHIQRRHKRRATLFYVDFKNVASH